MIKDAPPFLTNQNPLIYLVRNIHGRGGVQYAELLKWRPMPDKTREFTLRHNVQRHLGQSEDWII